MFLGTDGEFFHYFEEAPEAEDYDKGGDFFEDAVEEDVDDEACDYDEGIEDVEGGGEIPKGEGCEIFDREDIWV